MGQFIGLTSRQCGPESMQLLDEVTRERLRQQVPGWRVQTGGDAAVLRQEWTAKDADAAKQLLERLQAVAQEQGHAVMKADAVGSLAFVELCTPSAGGWGIPWGALRPPGGGGGGGRGGGAPGRGGGGGRHASCGATAPMLRCHRGTPVLAHTERGHRLVLHTIVKPAGDCVSWAGMDVDG